MASRLFIGIFALIALSACSGARMKRLQERDKLAAQSGLYCDFVNGDEFQDVEVELNMQMSRRCDAGRNYTLSGYKNSSDIHGLVYCCSMPRKEEKALDLKQVIEKSAAEKHRSEAPRAEAPRPAPPKPEAPKLEAPKPAEPVPDVPAHEIQQPPAAPEAKPAQPAAANESAKRAPPSNRAPASASKPAPAQKLDSSDLDAILEN